jgi:hypothetical protein
MTTPRRKLVLMADMILHDLRHEADDDCPRPPELSPLSSAQARRAARHNAPATAGDTLAG